MSALPTGYLPRLAEGAMSMPHSGIREIIHVALTQPGCIRLEVGEPDFATPAHIVEAACRAARSGVVRYVGTAGLPSLREKICAKLAAVNRIHVTPEQINIGVGGIGVIAAAFSAMVGPGDEVLVPDPAWPCYELMLRALGATMVPYTLHASSGYLPDLAEIESLATPRTKLIVINSPGNPTGASFPRALLEDLVSLAERKGLRVLSDECYDEVVFDAEHVSPASFAGSDRVISAFSFSKTYAMTGWRVGYLVSSASFADVVNKIHESNISCVSPACQLAAEAALDGPRQPLLDMVAAYKSRRDLCVELLSAADLLVSRPGGAFYIMADIQRAGMDARAFAFDLLRDKNVAVAPGTAFGRQALGEVRISLASSEQALRKGIDRLAAHVRERERVVVQ